MFVVGQDRDAHVTIMKAMLEKFASAVELLTARSEGSEEMWAAEASASCCLPTLLLPLLAAGAGAETIVFSSYSARYGWRRRGGQ